jgi:hypothetical protein
MNIELLRRSRRGNFILLIVRHHERLYAWFGPSISNVIQRAQTFIDGGAQ